MIGILFKATGIWLVIVVAAIFNGVFREKVIVPGIGADLALPLSGMAISHIGVSNYVYVHRIHRLF